MRKALSQVLTGILASFPHLAPADVVVSSRIRVKRFGTSHSWRRVVLCFRALPQTLCVRVLLGLTLPASSESVNSLRFRRLGRSSCPALVLLG